MQSHSTGSATTDTFSTPTIPAQNPPSVEAVTVVKVSPLTAEFFNRYFIRWGYSSDNRRGLAPDYEVVYIRDLQIWLVPQTGTRNGTLECVITLNGVDHVWIYRV